MIHQFPDGIAPVGTLLGAQMGKFLQVRLQPGQVDGKVSRSQDLLEGGQDLFGRGLEESGKESHDTSIS